MNVFHAVHTSKKAVVNTIDLDLADSCEGLMQLKGRLKHGEGIGTSSRQNKLISEYRDLGESGESGYAFTSNYGKRDNGTIE